MQDKHEALLTSLETSELENELQNTLESLREIDRWYDWELRIIDSHPAVISENLKSSLESRHRKNREPYVQYLAHIHQILVSRRMFEGCSLFTAGKHTNGHDKKRAQYQLH